MDARTVVGGGRRPRYVTPGLSYYWEGAGGTRWVNEFGAFLSLDLDFDVEILDLLMRFWFWFEI